MKKILTILLIIIIPLQISAQQIQEKPQKFENFKKDKIFKKKNVDSKRLHYRVATAQKQITKLSVNAIKQLDSLITQQRDQSTGEFINSWKEEYTYDDDNAMIQLTYFIWNTATGQWVYDYRDDYTYNANKNIAVAIYSFWNTNTNQWVFDYKDEYAYDTNGNIASLVYYDWNNFSNQWVNDWKDDYTYDSGVLISLQDYYWDTQTSQWIPDIKDEYSYDAYGNLILCESSYWADYEGRYIEKYHDEFNYNNANLIEILHKTWTLINNQWQLLNDYKAAYAYDNNGNPTLEIFSDWNESTNAWIPENRYEYAYDLSYNLSDLIMPPLFLFWPDNYDNITNLPLGCNSYNYIASAWVTNSILSYYSSDATAPLHIHDEILAKSVSFYPNPVDDILIIKSESIPLRKVEIFSILGKKIKEINSDFKSIRLDNLSKGIYIIKIQGEKGLVVNKLIKK